MTNRDKNVSLRRQILEILARGRFTKRRVADEMGVQSQAEVKQVYDAILELAREGKVASEPARGAKIWFRVAGQGVADTVQAKIWRACRLKAQKGELFSVADLMRLSGASRDYVRRYVRHLLGLGALRKIKASGLLCCLTSEEKPAPRWNRRAEKRKKGEAGKGGKGAKEIPPRPPFANGGRRKPSLHPPDDSGHVGGDLQSTGRARLPGVSPGVRPLRAPGMEQLCVVLSDEMAALRTALGLPAGGDACPTEKP